MDIIFYMCMEHYQVVEDDVGETCSTNVGKRAAYRLLVGKPEGKRSLGRPRLRWVANIKIDLLDIGWSGVDWIGVSQDRYTGRALVIAALNIRVPLNVAKLSSGCTTGVDDILVIYNV
jgi:hypothetical protein